jgi:hypothetical protein
LKVVGKLQFCQFFGKKRTDSSFFQGIKSFFDGSGVQSKWVVCLLASKAGGERVVSHWRVAQREAVKAVV